MIISLWKQIPMRLSQMPTCISTAMGGLTWIWVGWEIWVLEAWDGEGGFHKSPVRGGSILSRSASDLGGILFRRSIQMGA